MKFYKKIVYNLKRAIPTIGIAGLTMMPAACDTQDDTRQDINEKKFEQPKIVKHNVELKFSFWNKELILGDSVPKYVNTETVDTIFLVPTGKWSDLIGTLQIPQLRRNFLLPCLEMSPKVRGRGDFDFKLGAASRVPEDSLWFVRNGWTINKAYQTSSDTCNTEPTPPEPIPDPEEEQPDTTKHNIEIKFRYREMGEDLHMNILQKHINNENVDTIFLIPSHDDFSWCGFNSTNIPLLRQNVLQPRTDLSPKIRGRGDFDFKLGEASKVPEDSLWFVENGWTINKAHQR